MVSAVKLTYSHNQSPRPAGFPVIPVTRDKWIPSPDNPLTSPQEKAPPSIRQTVIWNTHTLAHSGVEQLAWY